MSADCIFLCRNHRLLGMHCRLCHHYHTLPTTVLVKQFRQRAMGHFHGGWQRNTYNICLRKQMGRMWNRSQENPNQVSIKQTFHTLKERNTKLLLKLELVQSFSINAQVIKLRISVCSAGFCFIFPHTAVFEILLKNNKSGEIAFMVFCFKYLYVFTKVGRGVLGCTHTCK